MKPFVFELETVLDIRKRKEEEASIFLAKERSRLAKAQALLDKLKIQQLESWTEFREKQATGLIEVLDFQMWYNFLHFLKNEIEKQEEIIIEIKKDVAIALKNMETAMKNRKTVEKLKEKRFEQYKFELLAEEQKILDEIAITRYQKKGDEL